MAEELVILEKRTYECTTFHTSRLLSTGHVDQNTEDDTVAKRLVENISRIHGVQGEGVFVDGYRVHVQRTRTPEVRWESIVPKVK